MSFPDFSDPFFTGDTTDYDSLGCTALSAHDKFLSIMLTSFIGAVVTGISAGWFIAFCTGWISFFATLRILVVGLWFVWRAVRGQTLDGGATFYTDFPLVGRTQWAKKMGEQIEGRFNATENQTYESVPPANEEGLQLHERNPATAQESSDPPPPYDSGAYTIFEAPQPDQAKAAHPGPKRRVGFEKGPPTFLGWVGWVYAACYFPIVQVLWLAGNVSNGPSAGIIKVVRALAISVTALSLTMDTKARYAVSVGNRFGPWAQHTFTCVHALSTFTLGIVAVILLILGAVQIKSLPIPFIPFFILFSIVWMGGSFLLFPPVDGGMPPNSVLTFLAGLFMGAFAGLFTSAPAFGAMSTASTGGATVGEYLKCESVAVWRKFIAIFP